jgi:hypothetical protein
MLSILKALPLPMRLNALKMARHFANTDTELGANFFQTEFGLAKKNHKNSGKS